MKRAWWLLVVVLFLAGAAIRLYDLTDPPLDFHPPRQIHSAILARGFYEQMRPDATGYQHAIGLAMGQTEQWIEPPIFEYWISLHYRLFGGDILWIPRLYSIAFWLLGGIPLFLLAQRISGTAGASAAVALYLFLPYGIIASRAFMPDPLMVCLCLWAVWRFSRWVEAPNWKRALIAGLCAGGAILVKQVAVFFIAGAFVGLLLSEVGLKRAARSLSTWGIAFLALLPVVAYNIYGVFIAGFLRDQYDMRFFPDLWRSPAFYLNWVGQIEKTIGFALFLLARAGLALALARPTVWGWVGWLAGYLIYGFAFAHHITTHDYYQLPLIPLAAVGLAPLAERIWRAVVDLNLQPGEANPRSERWRAAILLTLVLAGSAYSLYNTRTLLKKNDYRAEPALWSQIGRAANLESSQVIGLLSDYGARLMYWGYMVPVIWPTTSDLEFMRHNGQDISDEQNFQERAEGRTFFVVTDLEDFDRQSGLKNLLFSRFPIYAQGKDYLIFDLKHPLPAVQKVQP